MKAKTVIATLGTSLQTNLARLANNAEAKEVERAAAEAYRAKQAEKVADQLARDNPAANRMSAEINSLTSLIARGFADPECNLFLCHSDTDDGRFIAAILAEYYERRHHRVQTLPIASLSDSDPRLFRTEGLRNLVRQLCKVIRDYDPSSVAINATGGYKAQIAVAVLVGQSLQVPVYYMHERFNDIIEFPPLPVSLDFHLWLRNNSLFYALEAGKEVPIDELDGQESLAAGPMLSLVEVEEVDGTKYVALTPAGQLFHETCRQKFGRDQKALLPPAIPPEKKEDPKWEDSGHMRAHPKIHRFMDLLTKEVPQVRRCHTYYCCPDRPKANGFRISAKGIEGRYCDGSFLVKFAVETAATSREQMEAVVASLNDWARGHE